MTEASAPWPLRRYGWVIVRFLLLSGLVFVLWPFFAAGYVRLIGTVMGPLLHLLGFDATVVERSATTLRFDVTYGAARGLVTPIRDWRPILLNTATLFGLFSGAFLPPRRRNLAAFLVAALLLLLYQGALGAFLLIVALPEYSSRADLATLGDVLLASRSFVPILLWLGLDAGARSRLAALLARVTIAPPHATARARPQG